MIGFFRDFLPMRFSLPCDWILPRLVCQFVSVCRVIGFFAADMLTLSRPRPRQDDCWEQKVPPREPSTGELRPDPQRFPSGLKALGDYMHSKGATFGLCVIRRRECARVCVY